MPKNKILLTIFINNLKINFLRFAVFYKITKKINIFVGYIIRHVT
jgi:hypothetical protein